MKVISIFSVLICLAHRLDIFNELSGCVSKLPTKPTPANILGMRRVFVKLFRRDHSNKIFKYIDEY